MSLLPKYTNSHAIVIGINEYVKSSPLGYAVNDATSLAEHLITIQGFEKENVHLLLNDAASKASILDSFLSLAAGGTQPDDRMIFFFAGHGHTHRSSRGEVGYLVPHEGDSKNLATLIRWDEFTRNADLIDAKHVLFIMDACYGGLAFTRKLSPGSMRFLKDMLLRPARQVLTAGKANEVVTDLGGPLPDHSIFTGHLLEALNGKAKDEDGVLTANGLMAYVYHKVSQDRDSHQTPHFGYLDGDGDLVFSAPLLTSQEQTEKLAEEDSDILVSVPAILTNQEGQEMSNIIETAKEYLSEDTYKIKLHDLVTKETKQVLSATSDDRFPVTASWSPEEFLARLKKYEDSTADLLAIQTLLGYWGTESHSQLVPLPAKRMAMRLKLQSGIVAWNSLRWYPVLLLLYSGGIGAIAANKYRNLRLLFHTSFDDPQRSSKELTLLRATFRDLSEIHDIFKNLPGRERNFTPRSEHLLKFLQPTLDDLLFLGDDYEMLFDRFEVFLAIEHAHQYMSQVGGRAWGPVGRFGWKHKGGRGVSPYLSILEEAERSGSAWEPIQSGLFGGSYERFKEVATQFLELLNGLPWY